MRRELLLLAVLGVVAAMPVAAEAPAGATACAGCHAPAGRDLPVPTLSGRTPESIVADMQAFRSGSRPATVMDRIAKGFSDGETRAIANWLASKDHASAKP
ncbi:c-type cytochrome [Flaviflagellibacter deserti]|jgi:cytochrome subunit of sulfide dehydrogenase|uniref:C-type cytochrome n=1 Tax=Flaviflagellibacter deserti TaxID=2267266 RepID=A0ABV9Z7R8_9HYPH